MGLGVAEPETAGFLALVLVAVVVFLDGVVRVLRGVLVVVVLGAERGALGFAAAEPTPGREDAGVDEGMLRVVVLGVLVVGVLLGVALGVDLEAGVAAGEGLVVGVLCDSGTLGVEGVAVVVLAFVDTGVERADDPGRVVEVFGSVAALLAAEAALATLVLVAEGALKEIGVLGVLEVKPGVLAVDTGVVFAEGEVDVFVIVLDVVAVDIRVAGVGVGFCVLLLAIVDAELGLDVVDVVVLDAVVMGFAVELPVVGLEDLALRGCLVVGVAVFVVDFGGLVVVVFDTGVLDDRGVRFFVSADSGFLGVVLVLVAFEAAVATAAEAATAATDAPATAAICISVLSSSDVSTTDSTASSEGAGSSISLLVGTSFTSLSNSLMSTI